MPKFSAFSGLVLSVEWLRVELEVEGVKANLKREERVKARAGVVARSGGFPTFKPSAVGK